MLIVNIFILTLNSIIPKKKKDINLKSIDKHLINNVGLLDLIASLNQNKI